MSGPNPGHDAAESAHPEGYSRAPITPETSAEEGRRWHRLHPMTPFLRGGWFILAVFGWIISQQWQRITNLILPDQWEYDDPTFAFIDDPGRLLLVLGATVGVALVIVLLSYFSWRAHSYRLTDDVFEVRSGIVTKKHRQARLDRVQSIDINRPMFARIFGAAAVVLDTASADGKIDLKYVRSAHAEPLREAILRRASGARRRAQHGGSGQPQAGQPGHPHQAAGGPGGPGAFGAQWSPQVGADSHAATTSGEASEAAEAAGNVAGEPGVIGALAQGEARLASLIRERIDEFTDLERDTRGAAPQSVVAIRPRRLFAVALVDIAMVGFWLVLVGGIMSVTAFILSLTSDRDIAEIIGIQLIVLAGILGPMVIVVVSIVGSRLMAHFNYSIVGTPNGVRTSKGFPSTKSETVPPGRIHAIEIRQPMLWRVFGWWEIRITRAGQKIESSSTSGQNVAMQSVLMPVGKVDEVRRVLDLIAPDQATPERAAIIQAGMLGTPGDGYTAGPSRGRWLHPITFRRLGYVLTDDTFFIRRGRVGRKLVIVPGERMQSLAVVQGPVLRCLRLAKLQAQTVQGVVNTMLPNLDQAEAVVLFDQLRATAIRAAKHDTSHRWSEAAARSAISAAQMRFTDARARGHEASPVDLAVLAAYRDYEQERSGVAPQAAPGQNPAAHEAGQAWPQAPRQSLPPTNTAHQIPNHRENPDESRSQ